MWVEYFIPAELWPYALIWFGVVGLVSLMLCSDAPWPGDIQPEEVRWTTRLRTLGTIVSAGLMFFGIYLVLSELASTSV